MGSIRLYTWITSESDVEQKRESPDSVSHNVSYTNLNLDFYVLLIF